MGNRQHKKERTNNKPDLTNKPPKGGFLFGADMIQIRFKAQGSNSLIGGFSSGDVARVGDALAKHLVEDARVAEYVAAPAAKQEEVAAPARRKRKE